MSIYELIIQTLKPLDILVSMQQNKDKASSRYVTMIPLYDNYEVFADNKPTLEVSQVQLAIFAKGNYLDLVAEINKALIEADFTITNRKYIEYEEDIKLHHYVIDVAMEFFYGGGN